MRHLQHRRPLTGTQAAQHRGPASEMPARRATATRASSTTRSGSRQLSRPRPGASRTDYEHQLRVSFFGGKLFERSTYTGTGRSTSRLGDREAGVAYRPAG